jgi:transposase
MGKLIERCVGIDIGKRFLLCCVMTGAAHEEPRSETRRFDTTVPGLKRLRNWLNDERVTDVVMESTGSYWIPVFNLLEGHVTVVLANPEEVKNRKGHKTDRKDAEHLAASGFAPPMQSRRAFPRDGLSGFVRVAASESLPVAYRGTRSKPA